MKLIRTSKVNLRVNGLFAALMAFSSIRTDAVELGQFPHDLLNLIGKYVCADLSSFLNLSKTSKDWNALLNNHPDCQKRIEKEKRKRTLIFAGRDSFSLLVNENERVVFLGPNGDQIADPSVQSEVNFIHFIKGELESNDVVDVAAGAFHSLALTDSGHVYAWGQNEYGQLGVGVKSATFSKFPVPVVGALKNKKVISIAAGEDYSLALTAEGDVYSWGTNEFGQLGIKLDLDHFSHIPTLIQGGLKDQKVVSISSGMRHSLALTEHGQVFAWGDNNDDQLGYESEILDYSDAPVLVEGALKNQKVIAISAGAYHALALTDKGEVFAWGQNLFGQLGVGLPQHSSINTPTLIAGALEGQKIVSISAANAHSLALSDQGKVYAWGNNEYGQLGSLAANALPASGTPALVEGIWENQKIISIATGARYSLALTSQENVFGWGLKYQVFSRKQFAVENYSPVEVSRKDLLPLHK